MTPAGLSPDVFRGWQFSCTRVTECSCTFIFHEASLAVGNHRKALLKAADVEDLATGLSIRGCEDSGGSIAAVGSLGCQVGWQRRGGCTWLRLVLGVQEPTLALTSPREVHGSLSDRSSWRHAAGRSSTRVQIQLPIFF